MPEPVLENGNAIDEASAESFPASDPPAFTQHRVLGTPEDKPPEQICVPKRSLRRWLGGVAIGLTGAVAALFAVRAIRGRECS